MDFKGKNNPFFGKKHTKENKEKNRLAHLGKKDSYITKLKKSNSHKGLKHTNEEIEKIRKANTGVIFTEERKRKIGYKMSLAHKKWKEEKPIEYKERQTKACLVGCVKGGIAATELQTQRGFVSKPEKLIKTLLPNDFLHGKRLGNVCVPDFHSPQRKIVIEVDGDYWHSKPKCIKRDNSRNKYYSKMGYKIFRIPEKDVNKYFKIL